MVATLYFCAIFCCSFTILACAEVDRWSSQLTELKLMMASIDSKLSSFEGKVAGIQFLDHAFKINNVDAQLRNIDSKLQGIADEIDAKKGTSEVCATSGQMMRLEAEEVSNKELMEKIEDYGNKGVTNNADLLQAMGKQQADLENLDSVYRSGFSKLHQKMELVLEMDGQMSVFSRYMNVWAPKITESLEQLSDVPLELENIGSILARNGDVLRNMTVQLSNPMARIGISSNNPLKDALETSNSLLVQVSMLEQHSQKLATAARVATETNTALSKSLSASDAAKLRNLAFLLTEAEKSFRLMFDSFSDDTRILNRLLIDASKSYSDSNRCQEQESGATLQTAHDPRVSSAPGALESCSSDFSAQLLLISRSAGGRNMAEKLGHIIDGVKAVRNTLFEQCGCAAA